MSYGEPCKNIDIVSECERACSCCASHCGEKVFEGDISHYATSRTCLDCATICGAAVQILSRGGPYKDVIADACAVACGECATALEVFLEDEHMKRCAEACRKSERACWALTGIAAE